MADETPDQLARRLAAVADHGDSPAEPVHLTEDENTGDRFLIYSTESGLKVQLRYEGDALYMSQAQMAELFAVDVRTVNEHLSNLYRDEELSEVSTIRKFRIVRREGTRDVSREVNHYNLDAVISVGYRVSSRQGTLFRRWATDKLVQFATKGFVVDVERLKEPEASDHFRELRGIIREIRASEANVYHELRRIISLCSDYELLDENRKNVFFASVQNKLLYAVTNMTAAELRITRADASKTNMGLTAWKGRNPRKADTLVAKNYLGDGEIRDLNRFTTMLLDYVEQETDLRRLVSMDNAEQTVAKFIRNNERALLSGSGGVSKKQADEHCEVQYAIFDDMRKLNFVRDEPETDG